MGSESHDAWAQRVAWVSCCDRAAASGCAVWRLPLLATFSRSSRQRASLSGPARPPTGSPCHAASLCQTFS
eukprot:2061044-Pyramimonas_sp.AAC.1